MAQIISAKKCATRYTQTIIQCKELHRTCHSHQKKMAGDTEFSFLRSKLDLVLLAQSATWYPRQRQRTQNIDGMDFPTLAPLLRSTIRGFHKVAKIGKYSNIGIRGFNVRKENVTPVSIEPTTFILMLSFLS